MHSLKSHCLRMDSRWGPEQENAFQYFKECLVTAPRLRFQDWDKSFPLVLVLELIVCGSPSRDGRCALGLPRTCFRRISSPYLSNNSKFSGYPEREFDEIANPIAPETKSKSGMCPQEILLSMANVWTAKLMRISLDPHPPKKIK